MKRPTILRSLTAAASFAAMALVMAGCDSSEPDATPEIAPAKSAPVVPNPAPAPTTSAEADMPTMPGVNVPAVPAAAVPSADLVALGNTTFNTGFCAKCHMEGGVGSDRAPNLTDSEWVHCDGSVEGIVAVIRSGVPKEKLSKASYPFQMNSATKMNLPDDVVDALAAYVWSLSQ